MIDDIISQKLSPACLLLLPSINLLNAIVRMLRIVISQKPSLASSLLVASIIQL